VTAEMIDKVIKVDGYWEGKGREYGIPENSEEKKKTLSLKLHRTPHLSFYGQTVQITILYTQLTRNVF